MQNSRSLGRKIAINFLFSDGEYIKPIVSVTQPISRITDDWRQSPDQRCKPDKMPEVLEKQRQIFVIGSWFFWQVSESSFSATRFALRF